MTGRRWKLGIAGVLLVAAGLYLIGNDRVGLWDRDEPRYAQTSKQMLESNPPDWVVPRLLDEVRTAKPILIYWCQAASMSVFGTTPFAARLPSGVAMILTLSILGIVIGKNVGWQRAFWTVFILSTSGLVIAAAKMCIIDSVLLLCLTIMQLCLYTIYSGRREWWVAVVMWVAVGIAGLTKGPVVLVVMVSTLLVQAILDISKGWRGAIGWWKAMRPLVGLLIVLAVVSPWLIFIQIRVPHFLTTTLWHDVFQRTVRPLEGHKGPPGFYLLTIWGTYLPWSLLLPTAVGLAWKHRDLPTHRFAIAAAVGPWLVMEFVQTKLVHYVLPAFPAIAFLTADALVRCIRGQHDDLRRRIVVPVTAFWAVAITAIGFGPWLALWHFRPLPPGLLGPMIALSAMGVIYGLAVVVLFKRKRIAGAALAMGIGMVVSIAIFYGAYLPRARFMWLPEQVGLVLKEQGATVKGDVVMIDFKEDSLPYYQGGTIRARDDDFLIKTPVNEWPTWIVITSEILGKLPADRAEQLQVVSRHKGLAYADRGRVIEVLVVRKRALGGG